MSGAPASRLIQLKSVCGTACNLWQRFVSTTSLVCLAVREEEVDKHSDDWEKEDDQAPEDLVGGGAVRLKDLDWERPLVISSANWH